MNTENEYTELTKEQLIRLAQIQADLIESLNAKVEDIAEIYYKQAAQG